MDEPNPWADVDQYITYDHESCRWRWDIPLPGATPVIGSSDFREEARGTVSDYVRSKGPARVVARLPMVPVERA